jgi:hypothetical protein
MVIDPIERATEVLSRLNGVERPVQLWCLSLGLKTAECEAKSLFLRYRLDPLKLSENVVDFIQRANVEDGLAQGIEKSAESGLGIT